jgi:hypothetical protein
MQQLLQQQFGGLGWCVVLVQYLNIAENLVCAVYFFSNYIHWNSIRTIVSWVLFFVHVIPLQSENKH